jgi:hypothetical protein
MLWAPNHVEREDPMPALTELLRAWHDFHTLVGTASATLVGLMFVAASIGASIFNLENRSALQAFLSPTVVHFSAILFTCVFVTVPSQTWLTLGLGLGALGLSGTLYCGRVLVQLFIRRRFNVDLADRLFYALVPMLGYGLLLFASVLLFKHMAEAIDIVAVALMTLLAAGIRNAWDMMLWITMKSPTQQPVVSPQGRDPNPS